MGPSGDGVPVAGPMDAYSHRLANRLVGNDDDAAALEITLVGPELRAGRCSLRGLGAPFELSVDERPRRVGSAVRVRRARRLPFGRRVAGARATLAIRGGIDVPPVLGSRATSLVSGMGPFGGRALAAGDVLPIGRIARPIPAASACRCACPKAERRSRVILGPHDQRFTTDALERLFFRAVHRDTTVEPHGVSARRPGALHGPGGGHPFRRHAARVGAGAEVRAADSC